MALPYQLVVVLILLVALAASAAPKVDLYGVLDLQKDATEDQIRKAYKVKARDLHPDRQVDDQAKEVAREQFIRVQQAYEVLRDAEKRHLYDTKGVVDKKGEEEAEHWAAQRRAHILDGFHEVNEFSSAHEFEAAKASGRPAVVVFWSRFNDIEAGITALKAFASTFKNIIRVGAICCDHLGPVCQNVGISVDQFPTFAIFNPPGHLSGAAPSGATFFTLQTLHTMSAAAAAAAVEAESSEDSPVLTGAVAALRESLAVCANLISDASRSIGNKPLESAPFGGSVALAAVMNEQVLTMWVLHELYKGVAPLVTPLRGERDADADSNGAAANTDYWADTAPLCPLRPAVFALRVHPNAPALRSSALLQSTLVSLEGYLLRKIVTFSIIDCAVELAGHNAATAAHAKKCSLSPDSEGCLTTTADSAEVALCKRAEARQTEAAMAALNGWMLAACDPRGDEVPPGGIDAVQGVSLVVGSVGTKHSDVVSSLMLRLAALLDRNAPASAVQHKLPAISRAKEVFSWTQFQGNVLKAEEPVLVIFSAGDWCPPCTQLGDDLPLLAVNAAQTQDSGNFVFEELRLVRINCSPQRDVTLGTPQQKSAADICKRVQISAYPTIFFYPRGDDKSTPIKFEGTRHATYMADAFVKSVTPLPFKVFDTSTFPSMRQLRKSHWIFLFNAGPWCGPCTMARNMYNAEVRYLQSMLPNVTLGVVECDENQKLCAAQGVQGYPAFQICVAGRKCSDHTGERSAAGLIEAFEDALNPIVLSLPPDQLFPLLTQHRDTHIFMQFAAGPWCPPCTIAKKEFKTAAIEAGKRLRFPGDEFSVEGLDSAELARRLQKHIKFISLNCDVFGQICQQFNIGAFPTLLLYYKGDQKPGSIVKFEPKAGQWTSADFLEFLTLRTDATLLPQ